MRAIILTLSNLIDSTARFLSYRGRPRKRYFAMAVVVTSVGFFLSMHSRPDGGLYRLISGYGLLSGKTETPEPVVLNRHLQDLPESAVVKDGQITIVCNGERMNHLAKRYYSYTSIFSYDDIQDAFRKENPQLSGKVYCKRGTEVLIPSPVLDEIKNKPLGLPANSEIKAVYLRGDNTTPGRLIREVKKIQAAGANAIVFDVKDILGVVNYRSTVPEVEEYRRHEPPIRDIRKVIQYLHDNNIYVIARTALFQDRNLATVRSDLAMKDRLEPGGIHLVKGERLWVDPGHEEVRLYNLKLVSELVTLGVDEIQFDYVRYPAEGNMKGLVFTDVNRPEDKTEHIREFLAGAYALTRGTGIHTAIDIFGVVAWGEEADIRTTGQRIPRLATFVDIISPMLYPSHFASGYGGFDKPADEPYHFYKEGVNKALTLAGDHVVIRPWMQAFAWRVTNYNEKYIIEQIEGNIAGGGIGWMMWNAGNSYDMVYRAVKQNSENLVYAE